MEAEIRPRVHLIYSPRSGMPAAEWEQNASDIEIQERFERLLDLQTRISSESNKTCLDKSIYVLVSGRSKTDEEVFSGRTKDDRLVNFSVPDVSQLENESMHTQHAARPLPLLFQKAARF